MIIRASREQAEAILGAMRQIALAHGDGGVSEDDRVTIAAAAHIVFGWDETDPDSIPPNTPDELAARALGEEEARQAVRMLAVMSLVDGKLDRAKNELVTEYANALDVHEDYLAVLTAAVSDELAQASACMIRKNVESFPHLDPARLDIGAVAPFLPYADAPDPALEQRYLALGELPGGSFGRAFFDHFQRNGFAFPGNPAGLAEGFTTPHDTSHVLSGYSTSQRGELCVSTFIGAMHPDHPMAAEVLPVLFSWHLGIKLNEVAGSWTGAFEPHKFFTAWERGAGTTTDVVAPDWDFWGAVDADLDELRHEYSVAPAAPELLA